GTSFVDHKEAHFCWNCGQALGKGFGNAHHDAPVIASPERVPKVKRTRIGAACPVSMSQIFWPTI
ncbi:MAG: hypothetical protein ACREOZ_00805, partial [Gloeomargaritales cyanobacterium]